MSEVVHYVQGAGRWGSWLAYFLAEQSDQPFGGVLAHGRSARQLAGDLAVPLVSHPLPSDRTSMLWLCVPDDAIVSAMRELPYGNLDAITVVHASGSAPLIRMPYATGVAWPIQSISAEIEPTWRGLPIVLQGSDTDTAARLRATVEGMGGPVATAVDADADRQALHLCATLTQNFSNLLWTFADELLTARGLSYERLLPMARTHLASLAIGTPAELQTGPAVRGDRGTIMRHLGLLRGHGEAREAYARLSAILERRSGGTES